MVDAVVGPSPHCTPAASSISTSPCRMASTPSTLHTQHLEDPSRRGDGSAAEKSWRRPSARLHESRKRWERKAEAEAAADMYFGKNVGEKLHLMTLSPKRHCHRQDSAGAVGSGVPCTTILPASLSTTPLPCRTQRTCTM